LANWPISRKQKTTKDYFFAGCNIGWFVVSASIFAPNTGAEHLIELPVGPAHPSLFLPGFTR
jgi:solute:Na+ symporter, SSS family